MDTPIETAIVAAGATAPRIKPADIDANIVHTEIVKHITPSGKVLRWAVLTCRNGDLLKLAPAGPAIIDEVPAGRLYKDGSLLVDAAERTVPDRRRLSFAGIVSVALALTERGELIGDPEIECTGIPEKDADGNLIARQAFDAVLEAIDSMPRARRRDPEAVAEAARRAVRAAVGSAWRKKPMCHVHVLTV